jgi:hypothetical protein
MANPKKDFEIEELVFLKTDPEQFTRVVISITVYKNHVEYNLGCGNEVTPHFAFEISRSKTVMLSTD